MIDSKKIAEELVSVQPMSGDIIKILYEASRSEKELREKGYEPVSSDTRLMWIKRGSDDSC